MTMRFSTQSARPHEGIAASLRRHETMGYVPPDNPGVTHDSPREACGVFGVFAPGAHVAHLAYDGLYALQHRGQESAGMAASDGDGIMVVKDMGLVTNVFNEYKLAGLQGFLAIGHTRYSTTGTSTWHNAQPVYRVTSRNPERPRPVEFALGHNGNLTNTEALAEEAGMLPGTATSDSDVIAELLVQRPRIPTPARTSSMPAGGAAGPAGGLFPRPHGPRPAHRRPRPPRFSSPVPGEARAGVGAGV